MQRNRKTFPHRGRELKLMLSGRKKLAVFSDNASPEDSFFINKIPEEEFAPYVARGRITRVESPIWYAEGGYPVNFVCFTLPGSEWRAQTLFWIKREIYGGRRTQDDADEIIIARLLGYNSKEIADFRHAFAYSSGYYAAAS